MQTIIDRKRLQANRELAGEWRVLRAKIRHVIDRACVLAENLTTNIDDTDAIETLRMFALDYIDGRSPRLPPSWLAAAVLRLADRELVGSPERVAA